MKRPGLDSIEGVPPPKVTEDTALFGEGPYPGKRGAWYVGWTDDELDAWRALEKAAKLIMDLPEEHPMEREEAAHSIHQIQNYLLGRPALRRIR